MFNFFIFSCMVFFHPVRKIETPKKSRSKVSVKDLKERYDSIGLKPVKCVTPILDEFKNDFGWLRNDIQQFLRTSDPTLQASIVRNLEVVNQSDANKDATIEDVFDSIIPNNVQTPADIERFGRVLAERYNGYRSRHTPIADLTEKVKPVVNGESNAVEVAPET